MNYVLSQSSERPSSNDRRGSATTNANNVNAYTRDDSQREQQQQQQQSQHSGQRGSGIAVAATPNATLSNDADNADSPSGLTGTTFFVWFV